MNQDTIKIIDKYVRETCEITPDDDYDTQMNLFDNGYLDSLGAVSLLSYVEEQFGIEISQKDIILYPMNSVEEIAAVVEKKQAEK